MPVRSSKRRSASKERARFKTLLSTILADESAILKRTNKNNTISLKQLTWCLQDYAVRVLKWNEESTRLLLGSNALLEELPHHGAILMYNKNESDGKCIVHGLSLVKSGYQYKTTMTIKSDEEKETGNGNHADRPKAMMTDTSASLPSAAAATAAAETSALEIAKATCLMPPDVKQVSSTVATTSSAVTTSAAFVASATSTASAVSATSATHDMASARATVVGGDIPILAKLIGAPTGNKLETKEPTESTATASAAASHPMNTSADIGNTMTRTLEKAILDHKRETEQFALCVQEEAKQFESVRHRYEAKCAKLVEIEKEGHRLRQALDALRGKSTTTTVPAKTTSVSVVAKSTGISSKKKTLPPPVNKRKRQESSSSSSSDSETETDTDVHSHPRNHKQEDHKPKKSKENLKEKPKERPKPSENPKQQPKEQTVKKTANEEDDSSSSSSSSEEDTDTKRQETTRNDTALQMKRKVQRERRMARERTRASMVVFVKDEVDVDQTLKQWGVRKPDGELARPDSFCSYCGSAVGGCRVENGWRRAGKHRLCTDHFHQHDRHVHHKPGSHALTLDISPFSNLPDTSKPWSPDANIEKKYILALYKRHMGTIPGSNGQKVQEGKEDPSLPHHKKAKTPATATTQQSEKVKTSAAAATQQADKVKVDETGVQASAATSSMDKTLAYHGSSEKRSEDADKPVQMDIDSNDARSVSH